MIDRSFWQGRRVFLTGHTGFKGAWMSLWLESLGAEVTGYSLEPPTHPNLFEGARVSEGIRSVSGDIRDLDELTRALRASKAEVVFHLAAQSLVRESYHAPVETYSTNVLGTVHLLEAIRTVPSVRAVVIVTTDKCYENQEWVWGYREDDRLGGSDPYSNSKACAELVSGAFRASFFNPASYEEHRVALATARAGNVIGGGDWATDRLVPDALSAFSLGQALQVRSPASVRPWQFVLEPLRGYLMLAERLHEEGPTFGEAWNFGPGTRDARRVGWIVEELAEHWGPKARWDRDAGTQPPESIYLKLDISKAEQRLGWRPQVRVEDALAGIVRFHKALLEGADMRTLAEEEIQQYQALLPREDS